MEEGRGAIPGSFLMGTGRIRSNRFYQRQTKEKAWEGGRGGGGGGGGGREKERFPTRFSWGPDGYVVAVCINDRRKIGWGGGGGGGGGREKERFLARLSWELDGNVASVITELADFKPMRRQITWPPFFPGTLRPTYF